MLGDRRSDIRYPVAAFPAVGHIPRAFADSDIRYLIIRISHHGPPHQSPVLSDHRSRRRDPVVVGQGAEGRRGRAHRRRAGEAASSWSCRCSSSSATSTTTNTSSAKPMLMARLREVRAWRERLGKAHERRTGPRRARRQTRSDARSTRCSTSLPRTSLVVGKGGVGKTTCAVGHRRGIRAARRTHASRCRPIPPRRWPR